jgi:hypothetical protein
VGANNWTESWGDPRGRGMQYTKTSEGRSGRGRRGGGRVAGPEGGLINETADEETVRRAGRTRRPIYLPNNLP